MSSTTSQGDYGKVVAAMCGKCGHILVEQYPDHYIASVKKYYCYNCKAYPTSITYIYQS